MAVLYIVHMFLSLTMIVCNICMLIRVRTVSNCIIRMEIEKDKERLERLIDECLQMTAQE